MPTTAAAPGSRGAPPAAALRARSPGWRDPRLWLGVLVVAASVVGGARLLEAADDTVQVWAVASDVGAGDRVGEADLVAERVRFADRGGLDRYFTVDDELPADLALTRGVAAGELLPRAAVGAAADTGTVQVPVAVDAELVPRSVADGSVVTVYLTGSRRTPEGPVLEEVTVVDAPRPEEGFGTSGKRQLVLAVPEADAEEFFRLLATVENPLPTVVLVR